MADDLHRMTEAGFGACFPRSKGAWGSAKVDDTIQSRAERSCRHG